MNVQFYNDIGTCLPHYIYETQDKICKLKHDIDKGLQDFEIWEEFADSAVHFTINFVRYIYGRWL
jgi:hypothetical protein